MRQHSLQSDHRPIPAIGFFTEGDFILQPSRLGGQKASAARAITGAAPGLSFPKWAEVSGRIRSRK